MTKIASRQQMREAMVIGRIEAAEPKVDDGFHCTPQVLPAIVKASDIAALLVGFLASRAWALHIDPATPLRHDSFLLVFTTIVFLFIGSSANLFSTSSLMATVFNADRIIVSVATSILFFFSVVFALEVTDEISFRRVVLFAFCGSFATLSGRFALRWAMMRLHRAGRLRATAVIVGDGAAIDRFLRSFSRNSPPLVAWLGAFVTDDQPPAEALAPVARRGSVEDVIEFARRHDVDSVVLAGPWRSQEQMSTAIDRIRELPLNLYVSTNLDGFDRGFAFSHDNFRDLPVLKITKRPISGWNALLKAVEDYAIAIPALILLAPLLAMISAAVALTSPGPVLFVQKRIGFNNKMFKIYKFRTMRHEPTAAETVVRQATRGDPRVTPVGRFLRRTSLDELPQLLNVLNGTMSVVGPRPHAVDHDIEYGSQIQGYLARHRVKPGMTGWAQVNGFRGETRTIELMEQRIAHDIYYAENWSLFFDLKIILLTAFVVLFQRKAY